MIDAYADGVLDGRPAVTRHRAEAGTAWYLSTRPDEDTYRRLLDEVARSAGVTPVCPGAPAGVEAVRRRGEHGSWLFLFNHTDLPQQVPARGTDLLTATGVDEAVRLSPGGVAVLREH